ncbi:MAG: HAD family phosphatase, partial [Oscillospiraceae bacterium]|nr:HAD family phosphatase [Oscillospiraceae bacterium]
MIKAIAFDMDGVLFDTERISKSTWTQVGKEWNLPGVESLLNRAMGLNYEDTRTLFFKKYGKNFLYDDFRTR